MSRIRSENTKPEIAVRQLLHQQGFRYRIHARDLPGKPDIVFRRYKAAIFVHGCYWHGHGCVRGGTGAKTNETYWRAKIKRNQLRDDEAIRLLRQMGWKVLVLWECELKPLSRSQAVLSFLREAGHPRAQ